MDMKQWNQLVKDAQNRRMSTWRLGEIAAVVKDADGMWSVQVNTLIKEITEKDDALTAITAERDALRARLAALTAALSKYADDSNWSREPARDDDARMWLVQGDGFDIARAVLEGTPND